MKITLKSCLSVLAFVFFAVAIGMFALSFVDGQAVVLAKTEYKSVATGFQLVFGQVDHLEYSKALGTLFAFIFVVVGVLAACYATLVNFKSKKSKKGNKNAKLLCACSTFIVCGLVPALLLFLTCQTTGFTSATAFEGFVGANFRLGIGSILAAVFSLVGACSLSVALAK